MKQFLLGLGVILGFAHSGLAEELSNVIWQGRRLRAWLQEVRSGQPEAASNALYDFCRTSPVAIPTLIAALDDKSKDVRQGTAWAIPQTGSRSVLAAPKLLQMFRTERSRRVRQQVAEALCAQFPHGSQIRWHDEDFFDPSMGLYLAWRYGTVLPVLLRAVEEDKDAEVREIIVFGFRTMQPAPAVAVPVLLRARKDVAPEVRCQVAYALTEIAEAKIAVPAVLEMLQEAREDEYRPTLLAVSPSTHESISHALGHVGPNAVPYLLRALTDTKPRMRTGVAMALGRVASVDPVGSRAIAGTVNEGLLRLLKDNEASVRVQAARALNSWTWVPDQRVLPGLAGALRDSDKEVRTWVVRGIVDIARNEPTAIPLLLEALNDSAPSVRYAVFDGLRSLGPAAKDAVPALQRWLHAGDEEHRRWATSALKEIDPEAAKRMGVR